MNDWKSYKITWEKLALYFSGNATPEEEGEIKKWVSDDPVRAEIFKMLQEMWDMAGKSDLEVDVEKAWEGGNPIPFANVLVGGTTHGAAANVKGEYFIENITPGIPSNLARQQPLISFFPLMF